jgi:hypothetical protein
VFSAFQEMFDDARDMLLDMHSVDVLFCYDETVESPLWHPMRATLERNASEADLWRKGEGSQLTRQQCHFLFEKADFQRDTSGNTLMPTQNSVVLHDGYKWRASQAERMTVWAPEDHEGQVIRFRTTQGDTEE